MAVFDIITYGELTMIIIGVTGGIGAGKSTVTAEFASLGAAAIDADRISRQVMACGGSAFDIVRREFGNAILDGNGEIDRKKLAGIVFQDEEKLARLNALTHKCIFEEMWNQIIHSKTGAVVVLDVPLLFQPDFPFECSLTVAVLADDEVRIRRVMDRDRCTREQVLERMARQLSNDELREKADICLVNNDGRLPLRRQVKQLYEEVLNQF